MSTRQFDVIVIGAGNAGFAAARTVQEAGLSVAIIESREFGGTCPNRGCTPKKVLVAAAQSLESIRDSYTHGIEVGEPRLSWATLIDREQSLISHIPNAMEESARSFATVYEGEAQFTGPNEVRVDDEHLSGSHIVIATGSIPRPLPIKGAEYLVTSDDLLSNPSLPDRIVFIGGGVIALEFAHVFVRLGVDVTILEALPTLLPRMDQDAVRVLHHATELAGIEVLTDVDVESVTREYDGYTVTYRTTEGEHKITTDKVVNGTGRIPAVANLNLDAAGVKHEGVHIELDEFSRSTTNPSVFVAGDALTTTPQLSPLASEEGSEVGSAIVHGLTNESRSKTIPQAIHTIPSLASVGLSEEDARRRYPELKVQTSDLTGWFSARTYGETTAWAKVLVDDDTNQIVGAHLVGHRGEELIQLFALSIAEGIPASRLRDSVYAFPTFSSDIKNLIPR